MPNPQQPLIRHSERPIHEPFIIHARQFPMRIAIQDGESAWTYRDIDQYSRHIAHCLLQRRISTGGLVAVFARRSAELVCAILGVLRAGAAFLILDPAHPGSRSAQILTMARPDAWIKIEDLEQPADSLETFIATYPFRLRLSMPPLVAYMADTRPQEIGTTAPDVAVHPDDPAYVVFTSGSTGVPKGVLGTHAPVSHFLQWQRTQFDLNASDRFSMLSGLAHDPLLRDIFAPLSLGATLYVPNQARYLEPGYLADWLKTHALSVIHITPSLAQLVLGDRPCEPIHNGDTELTALRYVFFSGEQLTTSAVADLRRIAPRATYVNFYGTTETPQAMSFMVVDDTGSGVNVVTDGVATTIPIGIGISDVQLLVLTDDLDIAPLDVEGELYVRTPYLTQGYLNDKVLTQQKFIANPFRHDPQDRLYRTGDRGRYLPDGTVEFRGRVDDQVKIRGFRIELAEIEAALRRHPAVQEAVVVLRKIGSGSESLVAYVTIVAGSHVTPDELDTFLRQHLPTYMLPTIFKVLDTFPITPNGKIDRSALPYPTRSSASLEGGEPASRTPMETLLANIWSEVLGVTDLGVHDDFFHLGGDSLQVIRVVSRIKRAGFELRPQYLYTHRTIRDLAPLVEPHLVHAGGYGDVSGIFPLTPIQSRYFEQTSCDIHYSTISGLFSLNPRLEREVIAEAIRHLWLHHDQLRARIPNDAKERLQSIASIDTAVPFHFFDLSMTPEDQLDTRIYALTSELQMSLNVDNGPLFRAALFDSGSARSRYLFITSHHLVMDDLSWQILVEDLHLASRQLLESGTVQLPVKTTSFTGWADRLRSYAQGDVIEREREFWRDVAKAQQDIPEDFRGGVNTVEVADTVKRRLAPGIVRSLARLQQGHEQGIHAVLLAALHETLAAWIGADEFQVNVLRHGREPIFEDLDVSGTIGWFTSLFPVVLAYDSLRCSWRTVDAIEDCFAGIPSKGLGYGLLRYMAQRKDVSQEFRQLPSAQVSINYLGAVDQSQMPGSLFVASPLRIGRTRSGCHVRPHKIGIVAILDDSGLKLSWTYSTEIHKRDTIEQLADRHVTALWRLAGARSR